MALTNWWQNPGIDDGFAKRPFQTTSKFIMTGAEVTSLRNGSFGHPAGKVNLPGNFAAPSYIGKIGDPPVTVVESTTGKTFQTHLPLGAIIETPISQFDDSIGGTDQNHPYLTWCIQEATMNTNGVQPSGTIITGVNLCVDDGSGNILTDQVTGQPGNNNVYGGIQEIDLLALLADPNYVIPHILTYTLDPTVQTSAVTVWPILIPDLSHLNPGVVRQGLTIGIPSTDVRPAGKTRGWYALYDSLKNFGWVFYNVAEAGCATISAYPLSSQTSALATDLASSISDVMSHVGILDPATQTSLATAKGRAAGGVNAYPAPAPLDLSPTGGPVAPSTWTPFPPGWYPSGFNQIPAPPPSSQQLLVNTPTTQNSGATIVVTGSTVNYPNQPTIQYRDDATGSFVAAPSLTFPTASTFQFIHPAMTAGTHTITVQDANNTGITSNTSPFSVVAPVAHTLTIIAPSGPLSGQPFTMRGVLGPGYASPPVLTFADDAGGAVGLPTGAVVATTSFVFTHPGLTSGAHTTIVGDGTSFSPSLSFTVGTQGATTSPNFTIIKPGVGSLVDGHGNTYTVSVGGLVVLNGIEDATTANVVEMTVAPSAGGPLIWQENSAGQWFFKNFPTDTWSAPSPSPFGTLPIISVSVPAPSGPAQPFQVTVALTNFVGATPTLTYGDDGGAQRALPSGSQVSLTQATFLHPGVTSGNHTIVVASGSTQSASVPYNVAIAGWTSLPSTGSLNNTVTGLLPGVPYDFEVFATNNAGDGPPSLISTFTTTVSSGTAPSAPGAVSLVSAGTTTLNISWVAATGTAPIQYQTQWSLAGQNVWTNGPLVNITSAQITGLAPGTSYDVQVEATSPFPPPSGFTQLLGVITATSTQLVTWNSAGASPTIALSLDRLTATNQGSSTPYSTPATVISTKALSVGKGAFQVRLSTLTQNVSIGLVNAQFAFGTTGGNGATANGIGYYPATGAGSQAAQTVFFNSLALLTPPPGLGADVNGCLITVLVDQDNDLVWFQSDQMIATLGAGAYNDSASVANGGTADPANGLGGLPLSVIGDVFICADTGEGGMVSVLNASGSFVGTGVPSNFPPWSGAPVVLVSPGQVTAVSSANTLNTSVALTWPQPTGSAPMNYLVQYRVTGTSTWLTFGSSPTTSDTVTGLTPSTSYDFQVQASNGAGTGTFSPALTVSTIATVPAPGQVVGVSLGSASGNTLQATWQAPTTGGSPTSYTVQFKKATDSVYTSLPAVAAPGLTLQLTGLAPATQYNVQVFATNNSGNGAVSSPPASGSTLASIGNFRVSNGQVLSPTGVATIGKGINLDASQLPSVVTNAQCQPLLTLFPGITWLRINIDGFDPNSSTQTQNSVFLAPYIARLTALGIIANIEHHAFPQAGSVLTGTQLANEAAAYAEWAAAFKGNPLVWFGTTNEPKQGDTSNVQVSQQHAAIYNAVRNAGCTSPILLCLIAGGFPSFLGANNPIGLVASTYATMTNTIWEYHQYAGSQTGVPSITATINANIALINQIKSADGTMPIWIGEYGNSQDGSNTDPGGQDNVVAVQQTGLSCAAWHWFAGGTSDQLTDNAGHVTSPYGVSVATFLSASAPQQVSSTPTTIILDGRVQNPPQTFPDNAGVVWSISINGRVATNGVEDSTTAQVTFMAFVNGVIWQQNAAGNWFSKTSQAAAWQGPATSPLASGQALRTYDFLGSFFYNTHMGLGGQDNPALIKSALQYLNARGIRQQAFQNDGNLQALFTVGGPNFVLGLRAIFLVMLAYTSDFDGSGTSSGAIPQVAWDALSQATQQLAQTGISSFHAMELQNEANLFNSIGNPTHPGAEAQWFAGNRGAAARIRSNHALDAVPLTNMTLGNPASNVSIYVDMGDVTQYPVPVQEGTYHAYPNDGVGGGTNLFGDVNGLPPLLAAVAITNPGRCWSLTEIGYGLLAGNGSRVTNASGSKMTLNAYCDVWLAGGRAMAFYELYDDSAEGLVLFDGTGTPNAIATAIHNFTGALLDTSPFAATFNPTALPFTITGNTTDSTKCRWFMQQKASGEFDLVIWNTVPVQTTGASPTDITPTPVNLTVNFGVGVTSTNIYDPIANTNSAGGAGTSRTISISGYPKIMQITAVTPGVWDFGRQISVPAMPNGKVQFSVLLPNGYSDPANAGVVWPIIFDLHEDNEGGNPYPRGAQDFIVTGQTVSPLIGGPDAVYNTGNFRRQFPAIVVCMQCDQSLGSDTVYNFGGYGDDDSGHGGSGNEDGGIAMANYMFANYRVDRTRCYLVGRSLGAIGGLAWLYDYNRVNGTAGRIFTAAMCLSDQLFRPTSPNNPAKFEKMRNVPLIVCPTPSDNNPDSYDHPAWDYYSSGAARPTKANYDSGGVAAIKAPSAKFWMIDNTSGGVPWDSSGGDFNRLNADGGDGTALFTLLFSQVI